MSSAREVLRSVINKQRTLYNIARVMNDKKINWIIDELTRVRRLGYYSLIEEDLGIGGSFKLKKYIERLEKLGFGFTANIDQFRLGLMEYVVYIQGKVVDINDLPRVSWLKTYVVTYNPIGTFIEYYIPVKHYKKLVKKISSSIYDRFSETMVFDALITRRIRRQPSFSKYRFTEHPLVNGYTANYLLGRLEEYLSNNVEDEQIRDETVEVGSIGVKDTIDLIILKEFEKNAFASIIDISRRYGYESARFKKHLYNHIFKTELINGVFLKSKVFINAGFSPYLLLIETRSYKVFKTLNLLFQSLENVFGIKLPMLERTPYRLMILYYQPLHRSEGLKRFILELYMRGIIDNFTVIDYALSTFRKFTIPYMNFYPELRDWSLDTFKTHELFDRRVRRK